MARIRLGEQLKHLQTADLIRLVQSEPEMEYWFKHAAVQESAYGSLLKSRRTDLHRRVAKAIERAVPKDAPDRAAMLALHYERAGLYEQAFKYSVAAGDRALRVYALQEAIGFFDRALAMAERQAPPGGAAAVHAVHASRGRAFQSRGDNAAALENFQIMLRAAEQSGEPGLRADALNSLLTIQILAEVPVQELEPRMQEALRLAREANDPLLIGRALWNLGLAYRFRELQEPALGTSYLQQAHEVAKSRPGDPRMRELAGYVLSDQAVAHFGAGRFEEVRAPLLEALAIFRELDHRPMLADLLGSAGAMEYANGNPAAARAAIAEGLSISQAIGNHWTAGYAKLNLVDLETDAGNFERALALAEEGLVVARATSFLPFLAMVGFAFSNLYSELGRADLAKAKAQDFLDLGVPEGAPSIWRAMRHAVLGRIALESGDLQTAWSYLGPLAEDNEDREEDFQGVLLGARAIAQVAILLGKTDELNRFWGHVIPRLERVGVKRYEGEMLYWRGRLRAAEGNWPGAIADYERARTLLAPAEAIALLWYVDGALAEAFRASGDPRRAAEAHGRAARTLEGIAAGFANPELRGSFLARPEVARVLSGRETIQGGGE